MARDKDKNTNKRNHGYLASSETSSPTTVGPGYPNTPEKQNSDLKSHLMMVREDVKKDINYSIKEIQKCWAVIAHSFNPSIWEAEAGGLLRVQG